MELCEKGDKLILEETSKVYKKEKEMRKGRCGYGLHESEGWGEFESRGELNFGDGRYAVGLSTICSRACQYWIISGEYTDHSGVSQSGYYCGLPLTQPPLGLIKVS